MALKTWLNETQKNGSGLISEAQLKPAGAALEESFPGEKAADTILFSARNKIIASGVFYDTPGTRTAEDDVNAAYKIIMQDGKDFEGLRKACVRWVIAAQTKPDDPATAKLF
jgi:hypothetical protein